MASETPEEVVLHAVGANHPRAASRTIGWRSLLLMRVFDENPELIEEYSDE